MLQSRLDDFQCNDVSLNQALDMLRDRTHANIIVQWPVLLEAGIARTARVRREKPPTSRQELAQSVCDLLERAVDTDSWKDNGGSAGSVFELRDLIVVFQTPDNQRKVAEFLRELQTGRGPHMRQLDAPSETRPATAG